MEREELQILEMVKDGTVTPEQGAELLSALKNPTSSLPLTHGGKPQFVRVHVNVNEKDGKGDQVEVNCNLPIALADLALKMAENAKITKDGQTIDIGDYVKQIGGVDLAGILQMVKEGAQGKLVDVNVSEDDGAKVKVEVIVD